MAHILIVDDDELARFTIREILTTAGHEIAEAESGDEAIKSQKAQPFDLIVTDIIMPGKDGVEVIAELKQDDPAPVILAISAGGPLGDADFLQRALDVGADDILAKPFSEDSLVEKVNQCLKGSSEES